MGEGAQLRRLGAVGCDDGRQTDEERGFGMAVGEGEAHRAWGLHDGKPTPRATEFLRAREDAGVYADAGR